MRKSMLLTILFPMTVFLWLAGWTVFWAGSQCGQNHPAAKEEVMEIAEPVLKEVIGYSNNSSTKTNSRN